MTNKQLILLFIIGVIFTTLGIIFKVLDYKLSTLLLSAGLILESTAILIYALQINKKEKTN